MSVCGSYSKKADLDHHDNFDYLWLWAWTMFGGNSALNLDAKGRLAMPAKYRERLLESCQGQFVVTRDLIDPCLLLFPIQHWQSLKQSLSQLSDTKPADRRVKRRILGSAEDCELDKNGRFVLPAHLRKDVGLDKAIRLVGQGNTLQIWDELVWAEQLEKDHQLLRDEFDAGDLPDLSF